MAGTAAGASAAGEVAVEALVDRTLAAGGNLVRVHLSLSLSLGGEVDSGTGLGTRVSCRRGGGALEDWRQGEGEVGKKGGDVFVVGPPVGSKL